MNQKVDLGVVERQRILGAVVRLAQHSEFHCHYSLRSFAKRFGSAINLNRFRCLENDQGELLAFCAWTYISADTLDRVLSEGHDPDPDEWYDSGTLFFKEFIAPFGHAKLLVSDLRRNIFPDLVGRAYGLRGRIGEIRVSAHKPKVRYFFHHH